MIIGHIHRSLLSYNFYNKKVFYFIINNSGGIGLINALELSGLAIIGAYSN